MLIKDILEIILYVAPGFIALEVYYWIYPVRERREFRQLTWSLILGVILFEGLNWIDRVWLESLLQGDDAEVPSAKFIVVLLISGVFLGISFWVIRSLRKWLGDKFTWLSFIKPDLQTVWLKINEPKINAWAVVFLTDGAIYSGWISDYRFDPNSENQDFLLKGAKRVSENLNEIYQIDGLGVYMNTRDVMRIEFIKGSESSD